MSGNGSIIAGEIMIGENSFGKRSAIAKQSNECERVCVEAVGMEVVPDSPKMSPKGYQQSDCTYQYLLNLQNRLAQSLRRPEQ